MLTFVLSTNRLMKRTVGSRRILFRRFSLYAIIGYFYKHQSLTTPRYKLMPYDY